MKCFVTGASGFIGGNLVRELVARGHRVEGLVRTRSDVRGLEGVEWERVVGDINDQEKLTQALRGCDWCFHTAACHQLWVPDETAMFDVNVSGTRHLIDSALAAGCSRIVHTSTAGTMALPRAVIHGELRPTDESTPVTESDMAGPYLRSKWLAERIARRAAREGAPVVVVNPTAPFGPRDVRPTPTGQLLVDFLNRRLPGRMDGGFNVVHIRDVVAGHILAAEKGKVGERYILGNVEGNWTLQETFSMLAQFTGIPVPERRLSLTAVVLMARLSELAARFTGKPPRVPLAGVRMLARKMFVSPVKAIRELGLPQTPPEKALQDAVEWFRTNGYAGQ
jgi:dihydroflavonol-4-reductase